jgi:frataxin-like iron-binding protein CyaY
MASSMGILNNSQAVAFIRGTSLPDKCLIKIKKKNSDQETKHCTILKSTVTLHKAKLYYIVNTQQSHVQIWLPHSLLR